MTTTKINRSVQG